MDKHEHETGHDEAGRLRREAEFDKEQARRLRDEARILEDEGRELEDEARAIVRGDDDGPEGGHHHECESVRFTISVNGEPVTFEAGLDETMAAVRDRALEISKNIGRPAEDWDLKDEAGAVLDLGRTVRDYHFEREAILFLSLKAGVAGEH